MNLLFAAGAAAYHSGQSGGVSINVSNLAIVCLCVWALIREYRRHTEPKRAAKQKARDECAAYGHQWGEEYWAMGEYNRDCRKCGKQQHTCAGVWPER